MKKLILMLIGATQMLSALAGGDFVLPNRVAPAMSSRADELGSGIIYEAPDGKKEQFVRSGCSYFVDNSGQHLSTYDDIVGEIVTCENGEVYLKNPISMWNSGSYLKGYQEGDSLVFDLPQPITVMTDFGYPREMLVTTLQFSEVYYNYVAANTEGSAEVGLPEIDNRLVLTKGNDGCYSYSCEIRQDGYPAEMPGMVYGDRMSWNGFAEVYFDWKPFEAETISVPTNLSTDIAEINSGDTGYLAKIGSDGNDVYICGLFEVMPDSWIKGTRDGNKVVFNTAQYLGVAESYNRYAYFMTGKVVDAADENGQAYRTIAFTDEVVFDYDEDTQTLTTLEDQVLICNSGSSQMAVISYLMDSNIVIQPSVVSQVPAAPYGLEFNDDMWQYTGYTSISFSLSDRNIDGRLLNADDLYYRVYVNGEEYVFMEDEYYFFSENQTLIPYGYADNWDFLKNGNRRQINLYINDYDSFGVQAINIVDGEVVGESEIITLSLGTVGTEMVSEAADVVSVTFCDIDGRIVADDYKGLCIMKVTYSDGKVKTFKKMK